MIVWWTSMMEGSSRKLGKNKLANKVEKLLIIVLK
jgi:hypothetical protein